MNYNKEIARERRVQRHEARLAFRQLKKLLHSINVDHKVTSKTHIVLDYVVHFLAVCDSAISSRQFDYERAGGNFPKARRRFAERSKDVDMLKLSPFIQKYVDEAGSLEEGSVEAESEEESEEESEDESEEESEDESEEESAI